MTKIGMWQPGFWFCYHQQRITPLLPNFLIIHAEGKGSFKNRLIWDQLPLWLSGKESIYNAGDLGSIPGLEKTPREKKMATHSRILIWEIPWTEESGGLQSMGLQRIRQDLTSKPPPPIWDCWEVFFFF